MQIKIKYIENGITINSEVQIGWRLPGYYKRMLNANHNHDTNSGLCSGRSRNFRSRI